MLASRVGIWLGLGSLALAQTGEPAAQGVGWDGMPAIVWRVAHPGARIEPELVEAFGGVNVEGTASEPWGRELGLDFYVGHAPGRNDLHIDSDREWYAELWQAYWDTRDAGLLVRTPCLSERSTLEALAKKLDASLAARDGDRGLGVSLGDEVSLTPWGGPLDLCVSPACRAAFGEFLDGHSRWSAARESADVPPSYPTTDDTRLAWIEGDPRHVGAWLARRDFHHRVLHDGLRELAAHVRTHAPGTPVGLFGQSGRTAFGDVGVEEVLEFVDFLEVYRILDARELLYTLRRPDQRSMLTLFREEEAPHGAAWLAWEHWLRGGDGFVLWSDRDLETHRDYFESLRRTITDLRALKRTLPDWRPRTAGIAVLHAPDSLALSWLRDALNDGPTWMRRFASYQNEHGTREVSLRALLRLFEDVGYLPGSLPIERISAETVERFPVLVANELILVDSQQRQRLRHYVAAGGRLITVGDFARYDLTGRVQDPAGVEFVGAPHSRRILPFAFEAQRYLEERWSTPRPSGFVERTRERILDLVSKARRAGPEWSIAGNAGSRSWLRATQRDRREGHWLCAALPNAASTEERADLAELAIEIDAPEGVRIEWIHPQPADLQSRRVVLPAGDALVFRLIEAGR